MVAQMTLDQLARYLKVDRLDAKNALNRIGICAPSTDDESIIFTAHDLQRVASNIAEHERGWDATAASERV
jgi:hypothetical protein